MGEAPPRPRFEASAKAPTHQPRGATCLGPSVQVRPLALETRLRARQLISDPGGSCHCPARLQLICSSPVLPQAPSRGQVALGIFCLEISWTRLDGWFQQTRSVRFALCHDCHPKRAATHREEPYPSSSQRPRPPQAGAPSGQARALTFCPSRQEGQTPLAAALNASARPSD